MRRRRTIVTGKRGIQFSKLDHTIDRNIVAEENISPKGIIFRIESRRATRVVPSTRDTDARRNSASISHHLPPLRFPSFAIVSAYIAISSRTTARPVDYLTVPLVRSRRAFASVATTVVQYLRQLLIRPPRCSPYTSKLRTAANRNFD